MTKEYIEYQYPCLDQYPVGKEYITPSQIKQMAQQKLKAQGLRGKLSAAKEMKKLRAAFKVNSIWKQDSLRISFLDGTTKQQEFVMNTIQKHLEPLCSKIQFQWNAPLGESDIRISFKLPGQAWSMVGTDAKSVPKNQPTMNFGWLDDDTQFANPKTKNTGQVILHEFGHAMGMVHEHQNPKNNPIIWNKPVVAAALQRTQGWGPQQIEHNMFAKYGDYERCEEVKALPPSDPNRQKGIADYCSGEIVNGSRYDVNSIMHYFYPAEWILEGPTKIPLNIEYSELDKTWLRKYYGKPAPKKTKTKVSVKELFCLRSENQGLCFGGVVLLLLAFVFYLYYANNKIDFQKRMSRSRLRVS